MVQNIKTDDGIDLVVSDETFYVAEVYKNIAHAIRDLINTLKTLKIK